MPLSQRKPETRDDFRSSIVEATLKHEQRHDLNAPASRYAIDRTKALAQYADFGEANEIDIPRCAGRFTETRTA